MNSILPWRFPVWYFFSVILSKLMCISVFGPSSTSSNPFVILFIHSVFSLCFLGCHILVQNCSVSIASSYWYVFVSSPTWQNFLSLFWNVLFCLYCFTLCQYLFNLPSFASTFWFISSSCIVIFFVLLLSFCLYMFQCLSFILSFWSVFLDFLSTFPVEFLILVLMFSSCFLRGS